MSTITTRAGKGSPLTNNEVDANFTNLNTDKAELSGATFTGEIVANAGIALGDNDKATFGAGDDLQIYHDGNDSYIDDAGQGSLAIRGSASVSLQNYAGGVMLKGNAGSDTVLYHNNSAKIATTSTGIDVTGTATMDGLTVDGTVDADGTFNPDTSGWTTASFKGTGSYGGGIAFVDGTAGFANYVLSSGSTYRIGQGSTSGGLTTHFQINNSGDISFYEDTGTTPKLFWDASAESLGIGTSSPLGSLHVKNTSDNATPTSVADSLLISHQSGSYTSGNYYGLLGWARANSNGTTLSAFIAPTMGDSGTYGDLTFGTGATATERMRIDSSGNLLVGKTSADNGATAGFEYSSNDKLYVTDNASSAIVMNRLASDGNIAVFQKDGTSVGSIGAKGGTAYLIGSSKGLRVSGSGLIPITTGGANSDATYDIGDPAVRFKDLYLSGRVAAGAGSTGTPTFHCAGDTNTGINLPESDRIQFITGGNERARIDSSGNLLVGATSDSGAGYHYLKSDGFVRHKRDANIVGIFDRGTSDGDIVLFRKDSTTVGSISVSSSATAYNTSSDQRLKENIADADDAGSKIDAIQVRKYDWKADGSHQDYGMIAQELLEVAPEAVSVPEDSEEMMGVDYSKLVPMLIKEIQSLRNRVAQLEE